MCTPTLKVFGAQTVLSTSWAAGWGCGCSCGLHAQVVSEGLWLGSAYIVIACHPDTIVDAQTVLGIILGGGAGSRLYPLTKKRAKPAVPLGANYRLIDIPVSNCINSNVNKIYCLTQVLRPPPLQARARHAQATLLCNTAVLLEAGAKEVSPPTRVEHVGLAKPLTLP